jgi:hypothetical protein
MSDVKLASLNDIRVFFDRVGTICKNASSTGEFYTNPIDVKDFIEWCNDPCNNISENSPHSDQAYKLGDTVRELNKLKDNKLKEMESALKEGRWNEWCENSGIKAADDAVFYLVLKHRTDDQGYYHFYFDDDTVAEVDAFNPLTEDEKGKRVLDQQWHVLISLLAYLDVAHALSNEQHEYHCLYPYLSSYDIDDKGDFKKRCLRLGWQKVNGKYCHALEVVKISQDKTPMERIGRKPYHSGAMMDWIEKALTGKLASENPK